MTCRCQTRRNYERQESDYLSGRERDCISGVSEREETMMLSRKLKTRQWNLTRNRIIPISRTNDEFKLDVKLIKVFVRFPDLSSWFAKRICLPSNSSKNKFVLFGVWRLPRVSSLTKHSIQSTTNFRILLKACDLKKSLDFSQKMPQKNSGTRQSEFRIRKPARADFLQTFFLRMPWLPAALKFICDEICLLSLMPLLCAAHNENQIKRDENKCRCQSESSAIERVNVMQ